MLCASKKCPALLQGFWGSVDQRGHQSWCQGPGESVTRALVAAGSGMDVKHPQHTPWRAKRGVKRRTEGSCNLSCLASLGSWSKLGTGGCRVMFQQNSTWAAKGFGLAKMGPGWVLWQPGVGRLHHGLASHALSLP